MSIRTNLLKINYILPSVLLFGVGCSVVSCSEKKPSVQEVSAPELYAESLAVLTAYADSLRQAPDSASVSRLMSEFQEKLNRLNFKFPANTDLALNEDENDTLYYMTSKILSLRDARLKHFAKADTDSIITEDPVNLN